MVEVYFAGALSGFRLLAGFAKHFHCGRRVFFAKGPEPPRPGRPGGCQPEYAL